MVELELDLPRPLTVTDYEEITATIDQRFELLDGELLEMPAPNRAHQRMLSQYFRKVDPYVLGRQLGEVFMAPFDVELTRMHVVQPDLIFVAASNMDILKFKRIVGAPDLVVEIASPRSFVRDQVRKRRLYEAQGVREYWLGNPYDRTHTTLALENGRFVEVPADEDGRYRSRLFPDLRIDPAELFAGVE